MPEQLCCLAVDTMGGDVGPALVVPAVISALRELPQLSCLLYGDESLILPLSNKSDSQLANRLKVVHTSQTVSSDEKPASALRRKRESSLWRAIEAVAAGEAQACVSAGNTGALMAMAVAQLGMLPGIERPAICTSLPTRSGRVHLLDMGANISCDAEQLQQFALMATALVAEEDQIQRPRVGLLNVGSEAGKGDAVVQRAAELLQADASVNYIGFAEGDSIFSGDFDIIVCDGFIGNVALKTTEGVAGMISSMLRAEIENSLLAKISALFARPFLTRLQRTLNPANYNGASLLGLRSTVIKSHGGASAAGFANALKVAVGEVENNVPGRIADKLGHMTGRCSH